MSIWIGARLRIFRLRHLNKKKRKHRGILLNRKSHARHRVMCTRIGPCSIRSEGATPQVPGAAVLVCRLNLPARISSCPPSPPSAFSPGSWDWAPSGLGGGRIVEIMESWSDIAVDMLNYVCTYPYIPTIPPFDIA